MSISQTWTASVSETALLTPACAQAVVQSHASIFGAIGSPTVNAYITPAGSFQAFPLHNDEQDVFVMQVCSRAEGEWGRGRLLLTPAVAVQLSGRKKWRVFNNPSKRFKGSKSFGSAPRTAHRAPTAPLEVFKQLSACQQTLARPPFQLAHY